MHELTIAQNMVEIIEEELKNREQLDKKVMEVNFIAGRLNAVVPESLKYNFDHLKQDKDYLKDAELIIKETPIVIRCNNCHEETTIDEPIFRCQKCNSGDIEVISGKRMYIESLEIE
ncbi:MAG TPA: hydrogenase maturation nickel metallochaperone HypA [bacterium]|nr:hydrogenase maturation nickel metallochaperone HypA [bacterium]